MTCTDCRAEGADCLTADRVRVCSDCLYERVVKERDEALSRCETLRGLADTAAAEQGLAQRRMMAAQRERDEARAALSALDAHWLAKFEAETTRASQLEATVRGLEFEAAWLRKRLGDKAQLSNEKLAAAFTAGTLAAGDAMRDHLRTVAEAQREACAKYAFCQACANEVSGAPLVTEGDK